MIKDGAEDSNIRLPEEMELRLRFTSPTVTTNKVQKQHGKKKVTDSEQVCKQKEFDVGQKNITQSTHASDKLIRLVITSFHSAFSYNNLKPSVLQIVKTSTWLALAVVKMLSCQLVHVHTVCFR